MRLTTIARVVVFGTSRPSQDHQSIAKKTALGQLGGKPAQSNVGIGVRITRTTCQMAAGVERCAGSERACHNTHVDESASRVRQMSITSEGAVPKEAIDIGTGQGRLAGSAEP